MSKALRLTIEIDAEDLYAEDLPEAATIWADGLAPTEQDYLDVVLTEWFRREVGVTLVTLPGDKSMRDDFMVVAYTARVVAAGVREVT